MKTGIIVIVLGVYIFAMGMLGLARTSSFTPLFISGSIAAVTIWLGWLLSTGIRSARSFALGWLAVLVAALVYMTFGRIPAHADPNLGSIAIFGSMALFSLAALVIVFRSRPGRWSNGRRWQRT